MPSMLCNSSQMNFMEKMRLFYHQLLEILRTHYQGFILVSKTQVCYISLKYMEIPFSWLTLPLLWLLLCYILSRDSYSIALTCFPPTEPLSWSGVVSKWANEPAFKDCWRKDLNLQLYGYKSNALPLHLIC